MSNQIRLRGTQGQYNPGASSSGGGSGINYVTPPATSTSPGTAGQVAYDGSYFYICVATNVWVRAAISDWA